LFHERGGAVIIVCEVADGNEERGADGFHRGDSTRSECR
jgi:hypothetical protein